MTALPLRAELIRFQLLQLNDVYEITPVAGGRQGGLARVATLRQQLLRENPQTFTVLAGDFFSPSALGTAKVNGQRLAGQQMVAVLNALGLDYATFGNHEFDLQESEFLARLKESRFQWVSTNVGDRQGQPFPSVYRSAVIPLWSSRCQGQPRPPTCQPLRLGLVGVTLASNQAPYVSYQPPIPAVQQELTQLQPRTDLVLALTHQALDQDRQMAAKLPQLKLLLGGHEHDNNLVYQWSPFTPIAKADANARSVYVHRLSYDTDRKQLRIDSEAVPITDRLASDPTVQAVVETWQERGFAAFRAQGLDPSAVIGTSHEDLDGLESSVRYRATNLTDRIAQAMLLATPGAIAAVYNSGSVRLDDVLPAGPISQYDILRILPFGGRVIEVEIQGELLQRILDQGLKNRGSGGFLQWTQIQPGQQLGTWLIAGQPLKSEQRYRIAMGEYLLSGQEVGLSYLSRQTQGLKVLSEGIDIRKAVIDNWNKLGS
jgi:5'-nucleotidase